MSKTFLCAVDGSSHSQRAISVAAQLANATGAALNIIVVDQVNFDGRSAPVHNLDSEGVHVVLKKAKADAVAFGYPEPQLTAIAGRDVARSILNYAEEHGVEHIVVGTGEKSPVTRLVVGSVSHDLVVRAHCSVTVAR